MVNQEVIERVERSYEEGSIKDLKAIASSLRPAELVDVINKVPEASFAIYNELDLTLAVRIFKFLNFKTQKKLIRQMPPQKVATVISRIASDDRTWLLKQLPGETVKELLKMLSPAECATTISLLGYPKNSVGRLMTTEYLNIEPSWTARETINYVRNDGHNSETVSFLFVVDQHGKLIDDINIRDLIFASEDTLIADIMDNHLISLHVTDDQDKAINIFRRFNRSVLPVVDVEGVLLGIVTIDDILRLSNREATEDIQKIGGSEALDDPYMDVPFFKLIKKRVSWLVILFIGEMFTATAMGFFENEIEKAVVLALFVPLIISSGGNSGSQASTLIIRALALGEITLRDWWSIMKRELLAGLCLGLVLGLVGFLRITVWSLVKHNYYGEHWILVALTIFFSLIGVVMWGTLSGSMLPIILKKLGADPAASSAPFVATLVDVTGLVIYFSVAIVMLKGTLL